MIALHVGGASTATALTSVIVIFFLVFALSFAFGAIPEGQSRFSREWLSAWTRASLPRFAGAALFSAALFLGSSLFGGGNNDNSASAASCDKAVAPLTGQEVTDVRILKGSEGMLEMADAAANGRIDEVQALFFSNDAHNLTHDINAPLRAVNPEAARDLCRRVIVLESQMAGTLDAAVIERETRAIAAMLNDARPLIAASSPSTSPTFDICSNPVGAVTTNPLTAERIATVAQTYRDVARDAGTVPIEDLRATFGGDAHNLTHDIDGPLRQADMDLALDLCHSVLALEREFAGAGDPAIISAESLTTAEILEDAAVSLGIAE